MLKTERRPWRRGAEAQVTWSRCVCVAQSQSILFCSHPRPHLSSKDGKPAAKKSKSSS